MNYPLVNLRDDPTRAQAEALMQDLPQDATVFGVWWDIVPVEYLQMVEGRRPDLDLYNLFLFERRPLAFFVLSETACDKPPVIFLGDDTFDRVDAFAYDVSCTTGNGYQTEICRVQRRKCLSSGAD